MIRKTDLDMFNQFAGEAVEIEDVGGTIYVFGSELATLRIFAKYQANGSVHNPKARVGFSRNLDRFYFSLDMPAYRTAAPVEAELRDAWEGEGNSARITFADWVMEMADNPRGTLKAAATEVLMRV